MAIVLEYLKLRDSADPDEAEGGLGPSSPAIRHADKETANYTALLLTAEKLGQWIELLRATKMMDIREFFRTLQLSRGSSNNTKGDLTRALQFVHKEYVRVTGKPWPVSLWPSGPQQMGYQFESVVFHFQEEYTNVGDRYRKDLDKFTRANERKRGEEVEDSDEEGPHWRKTDRKLRKDEKVNLQADAMIKVCWLASLHPIPRASR